MDDQRAREEAVGELTPRVAARLLDRSDELVDLTSRAIEEAVVDLVEPGVPPLPERVEPDDMRTVLRASVAGNVETILAMLHDGTPLDALVVPTAARAHAVRLAQADVPAAALRRAYHVGTDAILAAGFGAVEELDAPLEHKLPLLHHLSTWLHRYVDRVTREVLDVHEAERAELLSQDATHVQQLVQRVVGHEPVDPEMFARATRHPLDRTHLAAVLWLEGGQAVDHIDTLRSLAGSVGRALGGLGRPLFTPVDRSSARVWFGFDDLAPGQPARGPVDVARVAEVLATEPDVHIALGSYERHVEGFRRTLEQADAVRLVAAAGDRDAHVVAYDEDGIAAVAMLARDLTATRRWVGEVLGPLAEAGEAAERTRETVRVFLRTGSYTDTSDELALHRNTVKYRISKVERERGRPLVDGRLDLELALHVCHVLGAAVLRG